MANVAGRGAPRGTALHDASAGELVTICAECKRVIGRHGTGAPAAPDRPNPQPLVSHGICEACARRLYGSIFKSRG